MSWMCSKPSLAKLGVQLRLAQGSLTERLANRCDPFRPFQMGGASFVGERRRRIAVVENDLPAASEPSDGAQGRSDGVLRQVGDDAQPSEERSQGRVEAGSLQGGQQFVALKVHRRVDQGRRRSNAGIGKPAALPGLGFRMVSLENPQRGVARGGMGWPQDGVQDARRRRPARPAPRVGVRDR